MRTPFARILGLLTGGLVVFCAFVLWPSMAVALPSYARQTGLPCSSCHMGFPELTPTGRAFKLNGYVWPGGQSKLPPLAVMLQPSFTHTATGQPGGAAPHFGANDNFALQQASLFYGGAIDSDIGLGAFSQLTYDSASHRLGWDNTDIRMAHATTLGDKSIIYGLTLNNNPTVQDVWNTLPAWRFPYVSSSLAPGPAAATMLEGGQAQQVLGLGGYTFWNNLVYAELSGYRSLSKRTQTLLGVDTGGENDINGFAPYWRVAIEPSWGNSTLEFGTFGMAASLYPQRITSNGTDGLTDVGVDAQYQFIGERDGISLHASWIHESQNWSASQPLGLTANAHDGLDSFNAKVSYLYRQTVGGSLGYFNIRGSSDPGLYGAGAVGGSANGSPNSNGWIAELDYMPFNNGGPSFWPWLNAKFSLQYVAYNKFNGGRTNYDGFGRNASDNNTLFLIAWAAF
ncbi:MAG TPA: hypothetical protein VND87_16335 [Stellaceae bacterium]|nr:hypothetical protein [Stellaceae bacterium]